MRVTLYSTAGLQHPPKTTSPRFGYDPHVHTEACNHSHHHEDKAVLQNKPILPPPVSAKAGPWGWNPLKWLSRMVRSVIEYVKAVVLGFKADWHRTGEWPHPHDHSDQDHHTHGDQAP